MYIPTWVVVAIVIGIIYFLYAKKQRNAFLNERPATFDEMWNSATFYKENVLGKSHLYDYLSDEREMVVSMENDMLRLKERFKHDQEKLKTIAKDWMDYAEAVNEIKFAREMLDVDIEDSAYDSFDERTRIPFMVVQEVTKRVIDLLADESQIKVVRDKQLKKSESMNSIFESLEKSQA